MLAGQSETKLSMAIPPLPELKLSVGKLNVNWKRFTANEISSWSLKFKRERTNYTGFRLRSQGFRSNES